MELQDIAYRAMTVKADALEVKFGERTNVETISEGRKNFTYSVWFCNSANKITKRIIKVTV